MYGTQTTNYSINESNKFENDVKMYGTQTGEVRERRQSRLRMM